MRRTILLGLIGVATASPLPAQNATRSADDIECALLGDECARAASDAAAADSSPASMPAPAIRGRGRTSNPRSFTLSTPPPTTVVAKPRDANAGKVGQALDLLLSFELNSATLTSAARAEAQEFARALARPKLQGMRFRIEGHTDSSGNADYNLDLSRRRAEAAREYLLALGIAGGRLEASGFGFSKPLPGHRANSPDNRRVEAVRLQ